ncbi:Golgi microtubule-associated protein [Arctopsyche grandis]|uniref:Golgi microtubule-associated protein n=1 Tax=Arctopsyche grandis TaxID=121162 RepID=UPI00406D7EB7
MAQQLTDRNCLPTGHPLSATVNFCRSADAVSASAPGDITQPPSPDMSSWLNFNQSLSSLKGQLTSLASEVLADDSTAPPSGQSTDSDDQNDTLNRLTQLQELCDAQQNEIKTLRKENAEYYLQKTNQSTPKVQSIPSNSNSRQDEDSSWFWDPQEDDAKTQDQSSLKKENDELHAKVKSLQCEISNMKSNIQEVSNLKRQLDLSVEENANLALSLDDLDTQNQLAVDKILKIKNELQTNYETLQKEFTRLQSEKSTSANQDHELKLQESNEKLHKNVETLRHKYDNLEKVHRLLTENTEKFQEENLYLSEDNAKLLTELEEINDRFDNLEKASKSFSGNIEKLQEENHELNEENFKLQEEVTRLQNDLEEMSKSKHSTSDKHNSRVTDEKYRELEEKFLQLEMQFSENVPSKTMNVISSSIRDANAQDIIEKLKFEIVELQNKLNTNEEIKRLNLENDHLRKEIESLTNSENGRKTVSLDVLKSIFDKHLSFDLMGIDKSLKHSQSPEDIVKFVDGVLKAFAEFKSRNETLEIRVAENSKVINNLESKMDELNAEVYFVKSDLSVRERELSEMKNNNDFLIAEIGALKSPSKLEPILEQNEDNVVMLQNELDDCSNRSKSFEADLETSLHEVTLIKSERDELKRLLDETNSQIVQLKNRDESIHNNETSQLLQKLSESRSEIEKSKSQICSLAAENEKLKIDFSIIDNEKIILMEEISELKADITSKAIICEHAKKVENEKTALELKLVEYNTVREKLEGALIEKDTLLGRLNEATVEYSSIKEIASAKEIELIKKEEELTKMQLRIANLQSQSDNNNQSLSDANDQINDLNQKLNEADALKVMYKQSVEELKHSKELMENYEKQNVELQKFVQENIIKNDELVEINKLTEMESNHNEIKQRLEGQIGELTNAQVSLQNSLTELANLKDAEISALNVQMSKKSDELAQLKIENENIISYTSISKDYEDTMTKLAEVESLNATLEETIKTLENEKMSLQTHLGDYDHSIKDDQVRIAEFGLLKVEMENQLEHLTTEKNELIALVTQKHNENINYHAEIQRLNEVLCSENTKYKELTAICLDLQNKQSENCANCHSLMEHFNAKERQCVEVMKALEETQKTGVPREEIEKLQEKNIFLAEKCEILGKNLLQEQTNTKQIIQDKNQIIEKEQTLEKEVERLRRHLLEVEEAHTHELVGAEQRCQELQTCLAVAEEKAKHSNTLYTSNNIRANQEVETLRNQLRLVEKQRDDIQGQLNQSEDRNNKNVAALTNLQCVLEQFQMDKSRDNDATAGRLKRDLDQSGHENQRLLDEMAGLQDKLRDSNNGLKAAARLSSQLEARVAQLNDMKHAVAKLEAESLQWKEKYQNTISNQQDKVDKSLIKNLLIGLIQASNQKKENKLQVLRLLSTVLDFDQRECEKVGLGSKAPDYTGESLAQEFVKFLEKESRPALNTVLPNLLNLGQTSNVHDGKPPVRKISGLVSLPIGYHQSSEANSRGSGSSGNSPHHRMSPASNVLLNNYPTVIVPITIENAILSNASASPVSVSGGHADGNLSRAEPVLTASGFSLFTPIASPDVGVNQTRNTEGAILKNVLKDT